jgi:hypothetical protein
MTQIEVENNTPYRRRVFLHPMELSVKEPVPLLLAAWKHFDLGPGESVGAALGALRVGVRAAYGSALDHRTVVADVNYGDICTYELTGGIPALSVQTGAMPGTIQVLNGLSGPDASIITVTFYWDYSPWTSYEVSPQFRSAFTFVNQLFAYASKPITDGSSALVIEPDFGKFQGLSQDVKLKITPSDDGTEIQWSAEGVRQ